MQRGSPIKISLRIHIHTFSQVLFYGFDVSIFGSIEN